VYTASRGQSLRRQHSSSTVFLLVLAIFGVVLTGYISLRDGQPPATMTGRLVGRTARFPIAIDPAVLPIIKRANWMPTARRSTA
jgi:hypothetical protein